MEVKDYTVLEFDYKHGCKHYNDIEHIFGVNEEIKKVGAEVIHEEVNQKISRINLNPWFFLLIVFGIGLIVLGVIVKKYIANFFAVFLIAGAGCIVGF